jgi:hypothetical protein
VAYGWVHQAAHLLANHDEAPGPAVRAAYHTFLATVATEQAAAGTLAPAGAHFLKVTASYGDGLFHCYEVPDLPRTNNDLERCFGSMRYHERRVTGRRSLPAGLVVRGSARALAVLTAGRLDGRTAGLRLTDRAAWQTLRRHLDARHEARRAQRRFRRDPTAYLAALEQRLLK